MPPRRLALFACAVLPLAGWGMLTGGALARSVVQFETSGQSRAALEAALAEQRIAARRAGALEKEAAEALDSAEKAAREAAALAGRIQESEAAHATAQARIALVAVQRQELRLRLAAQQRPLMHLTASLQNFARRPVALSVIQPGSVRDMVYLRAMLSTSMPQVQYRTAGLRSEIARGKALQVQAGRALIALREEGARLGLRRTQLAALETRERIAASTKGSASAREAERALALAEEARDLDGLVDLLDRAGDLRGQLAALHGPILRPPRPGQSQVINGGAVAVAAGSVADSPQPPAFRLPVDGRTIAGFGAPTGAGTFSSGITLAPREGAQLVAPAAGRVAFAGPYRGYGQIVILEHEGGWTSLVTGLARIDVSVGEQLVASSPIGITAQRNPLVTVELRRQGEPVNPLTFIFPG